MYNSPSVTEYSTKTPFPKLTSFFGRQAQLDMNNIPDDMEEFVKEARELFYENGLIRIKYDFFEIKHMNEEAVILMSPNETCLTGSLLPGLFKECHAALAYTLTIDGYDRIMDIAKEDIMLSFFADAWGSAYAGCADTYFNRELRDSLEEKGLYLTSAFNPGNHMFPLENQRQIFGLLKPEDTGLHLTESMLMMPSKSISAVAGLSTKKQDTSLVSCDFCNMKDTCPTAYT